MTFPDRIEAAQGGSRTLYCSFCGKSQHEVRKLVVGPDAGICEGCIGLAIDVCMADGITPDTYLTPQDALDRRMASLPTPGDAS